MLYAFDEIHKTVRVSISCRMCLEVAGWRLSQVDPASGGRRKNLLRAVLQPGRSSMEELSASQEKWEDLVRRCERSRDTHGRAAPFTDDIKQEALAALVSQELERHLPMNAGRLSSCKLTQNNVRLFLETRLGHKLREPQVVPTRQKGEGDSMDVDSFHRHGGKDSDGGKDGKSGKGAKGGRKGKCGKKQAFDGCCNHCNKYGHKEADCWSVARPGLDAQGNKRRKGGKGRGKQGKGGGKKGGGHGAAGSLEVSNTNPNWRLRA